MVASSLSGAFYMPITTFCSTAGQPIDQEAYCRLVSRMVAAGAKNIICGAATGAAAELDADDMLLLVKVGVDAVKRAGKQGVRVFGSVPWETKTALCAVEAMLKAGAAGFMELPPSHAYASDWGMEARYRAVAAQCSGMLIPYAKGDSGVIPSDKLLAKLAGERLIIAVKRACDSVPFGETAAAVRAANPDVAIIQGAAERFVPGVVGVADGYTTGTGVVFPHISAKLETAFLAQDHAEVRRLVALFAPIEKMRAEHATGYNMAPLLWMLSTFYGIGNGTTRPRFMPLLKEDEPRLRKLAEPLVEMEAKLAGEKAAAASEVVDVDEGTTRRT